MCDYLLQKEVPSLRFKMPGPENLEVVLKNGAVGASGQPERLIAEVYGDADHMEAVATEFRARLADALDCLCMLTSVRYQILKVRRVIEWEPGVRERSVRWMHTVDARFPPQPALHAGFALSIEELAAMDMPQYLRRALHCYRKAMITPRTDDQFLEFWRALEVLAEGRKEAVPVRLRCRRCAEGFLKCEACGNAPEQIPSAIAAMQEVLELIRVPEPAKFLGRLKACRDKLTHGSSEDSVSRFIGQPLTEVIGDLSRAVWFGLKLLIPGSTFSSGQIAIYPPSGDVVVREMIVGATGTFSYEGDGEHPDDGQIPDIKTELTWHDELPTQG